MKDVLPTLERWAREGRRAAVATVVETRRSAPRQPGSVMAVSESGEVVGSVTGGCVEPDVYAAAESVLAGGPAQVNDYGYADEEAFEVGLPCGGEVRILVEAMEPTLFLDMAAAVREERPVAYLAGLTGETLGRPRLIDPRQPPPATDEGGREALRLLGAGETGTLRAGEAELFVHSLAPRPDLYVFGAIDFASSLASAGRFLGYRVTVCDARGLFVTPERFPDADELVVEWPHRLLERSTLDERSAVCVLTHDAKFDVPALQAALATPAGYIGAMGSSRTTERRTERLREEGASEAELARIHAPIGLPIGAKTPPEVAIAIVAEIVAVRRRAGKEALGEARARV